MIRVVVTGAAGRMGQQLVRLVEETDGVLLAGAVERPDHPDLGRDAGEVCGIGNLDVPLTGSVADALADADVVVDFTSAEASMAHLEVVRRLGRAIVIGSTGLSAEQRAEIRRPTDRERVFMAPNMSIGINVLRKVVGEVARLLGTDYDVEIVEAHHRFKKDSPSGTALALAEAVADALGRDLDAEAVYGRKGLVGERGPREVGIHAVRTGDVVGEHTVIFGALGERVEITHKASSRETFARGAVRAVLWLPGQPPGSYDMLDLLGLR